MHSSVENDDGTLASWALDDVIHDWDNFARQLKFRTFVDSSNSRRKSCQRLTILLRQNAVWLDCSKRTDLDRLFDRFQVKLCQALGYMVKQGIDETNNILGADYKITLGFWAFCRDFKNIHHLAALHRGEDPDVSLIADQQRRKEKARLLSEFSREVKSFATHAAYLSGSGPQSNAKLAAALELARQALDQATDDLRWEAER